VVEIDLQGCEAPKTRYLDLRNPHERTPVTPLQQWPTCPHRSRWRGRLGPEFSRPRLRWPTTFPKRAGAG
jgi:hypothetical protein